MRGLFLGLMMQASFLSANSLNLFNDSPYVLKAEIYDQTGILLEQVTLNPGDGSEWSDNYDQFGTDIGAPSEPPYSVSWFCLAGSPFGICNNVAGGAMVRAEGCGGNQECGGN